MKQVRCLFDTFIGTHYFKRGSTYTVDDDFNPGKAFEVLKDGIKGPKELIEERLKASGIKKSVAEQKWIKERAQTDRQKLEVLEQMIADRDRSSIEQRQKRA